MRKDRVQGKPHQLGLHPAYEWNRDYPDTSTLELRLAKLIAPKYTSSTAARYPRAIGLLALVEAMFFESSSRRGSILSTSIRCDLPHAALALGVFKS